jgi:hypothetical protein
MTERRKQRTSAAEYSAMFKFLDEYDNGTFPDDVGGLLGQLSLLREGTPFDRKDVSQWRKAVSLAVTAS